MHTLHTRATFALLLLLAAGCTAPRWTRSGGSVWVFPEEGRMPPLLDSASTAADEGVTFITATPNQHEYSPAVIDADYVAYCSIRDGQQDLSYVNYREQNQRSVVMLLATEANEKAPFVARASAANANRARCFYVTDGSGTFQVFSGSLPKVQLQQWEVPSRTSANWPRLSPDESMLIYSVVNPDADHEIWVHDMTEGRETQVTTGQRASWNPADGHEFVYAREDNALWSLWKFDLETGKNTKLTQDLSDNFDPAYSPDGRQIAFTSNRSGSSDIWVMDADGSNPRQVTRHGKADCQPAWTPDSTFIVFASSRTGSWDLYMADVSELLTNAANQTGPR